MKMKKKKKVITLEVKGYKGILFNDKLFIVNSNSNIEV